MYLTEPSSKYIIRKRKRQKRNTLRQKVKEGQESDRDEEVCSELGAGTRSREPVQGHLLEKPHRPGDSMLV